MRRTPQTTVIDDSGIPSARSMSSDWNAGQPVYPPHNQRRITPYAPPPSAYPASSIFSSAANGMPYESVPFFPWQLFWEHRHRCCTPMQACGNPT